MGIVREPKLVLKRTFLEFVDLETSCGQPSRPRCYTDSALVLTPSGSELASPLETSEAGDRSSLSEFSAGAAQDKIALPECLVGEAECCSPPASPWQGPVEWVPVDDTLEPSCQLQTFMPMTQAFGFESLGLYNDYSFTFWPFDAEMLPHYQYILPHEIQGDVQQQPQCEIVQPQQQQQQQETTSEDARTSSLSESPDVLHTSVMLRNIPKMYSRNEVRELIDSQGFAGKYDFLYLPMDFKQGTNLGYAFVNLSLTTDAHEFVLHFAGFKGWLMSNEEVCEVSWSNQQQGLDQHIERYRNSPVMHEIVPEEWKPLILAAGQVVPFPAPTKKIKSPRIRCGAAGARETGRSTPTA